MQNSSGYIRRWQPQASETGEVFGCGGDANGRRVAFQIDDFEDAALKKELRERGPFELTINCDPRGQPSNTLWVTFFWNPRDGFAREIVSQRGG